MKLAVFAALLLASCVHQAPVNMPTLIRPKWRAIEDPPGTWHLAVADRQAQEDALKELCPPKQYICQVQELGKLIVIERRKK